MSVPLDLRARLKNPALLVERCKVGSRWVGPADENTLPVHNPATGECIATVPSLDATMADVAIGAALTAFQTWQATTAKHRADILMNWHRLMLENLDDLALILTFEQGKPLHEAKGEIAFTASFFEWFAAEGRRAYGTLIPPHQTDKRLVVMRQPVGVVGVITPWNFPAGMIGRKVAPALAAGCTVVIKPASQTPLTALALVWLAEQAGVPDGVVNIVTGPAAEIGNALVDSPEVAKITFTGSTAVGKRLYERCAKTMKHLSLELGGNAPFIVFADADVDAAVAGAVQAKFRNAGQTCVCANRILVEAPLYDQFVARFAQAVAALKVGNGLDDGVSIGPLIDERAVNTVRALVDDACQRGAAVLGTDNPVELDGHFVEPVILVDVPHDARVCREEIFGPVAPVLRFDGERQAIALANAGKEGLAAYFYSRDVSRVWRVAEALECGLVGVNTGLMTTAEAPFGGVKESGLGREGGKEGLDAFLYSKTVCVGDV
ncbi:NAD-dependent succinate-semialdehyde dehydrogenase [Pseudomonas sp. SDO5271_S396]